MTADPNHVDVSKLNRQQLQQWCSSLAQQQSEEDGTDYLQGWTAAKSRFPQFWIALAALPSDAGGAAPSVLVSPAQRAAVPQLSQDRAGLYAPCAPDEADAVWKGCGNSFDGSKAEQGFSTLVGLAIGRGLSQPDAVSEVKTRFPALAAQKDGIIAARRFAANPNENQPGTMFPAMRPAPPPPSLSNPFPQPLGNEGLSQKMVRQTYSDALAKRMAENPGCDPTKAHTAVMAAHPSLAAAFAKKPMAAVQASEQRANQGSLGAGPSSLGNEIDPDDARELYQQAVAKHLADNPGDNSVSAHGKVLKAFPKIAAALQARQQKLKDSAAAGRDYAVENSRRPALGNARLALANCADDASDFEVALLARAAAKEASVAYGSYLGAVVQTMSGVYENAETILARAGRL